MIKIRSFAPADVWALACIIIEVITLSHPFYDKDRRFFDKNKVMNGEYDLSLIKDIKIRNLTK